MRVLMIDDNYKAIFEEMKKYAAEHAISRDIINEWGMDRKQAKHHIKKSEMKPGLGDVVPPTAHVVVPDGYIVHYTNEEQPCGMCGHLSIAVETKGNVPNRDAVELIARHFGMSLETSHVWLAEFEEGHDAVNLIEPLPPTGALQ